MQTTTHFDVVIIGGSFGCVLTEPGLIQITEFGETSVPGVFAAGDATPQCGNSL